MVLKVFFTWESNTIDYTRRYITCHSTNEGRKTNFRRIPVIFVTIVTIKRYKELLPVTFATNRCRMTERRVVHLLYIFRIDNDL